MALVTFILSKFEGEQNAGQAFSLRAEWVMAISPYTSGDLATSVVMLDRPVGIFAFNFENKDNFKVMGTQAENETRVNNAIRLAVTPLPPGP